MSTERDPLLPPASNGRDHSTGVGLGRPPLGPLEIDTSTRFAILAGLWSATFLSVCIIFNSI